MSAFDEIKKKYGTTQQETDFPKGESVFSQLKTKYQTSNTHSPMQFDSDLLKATTEAFKASWEYNLLDAEDAQRKAQGIMPKSVEKKYNFKDANDLWLYENSLPYSSKFSSDYQEAEAKARETAAKKQKEEAEKAAYQSKRAEFENELFDALYQAQQAEYSAAAREKRNPKRIAPEDIIGAVLGQEKYYDVAKNFKAPKDDEEPAGYDIIAAMIGANKKENPNAFTVEDLMNEYMKREAMAQTRYDAERNSAAPMEENPAYLKRLMEAQPGTQQAMTAQAQGNAPRYTEDELRTMYDAEMSTRRPAADIAQEANRHIGTAAFGGPDENWQIGRELREQADTAKAKERELNDEYRLALLSSAVNNPNFAQKQNWDTWVEEIHDLGASGLASAPGQELPILTNETRDNSILQMTGEERAIYAYHAATNPQLAEEYIQRLMPELNARYAESMAAQRQGNIPTAVVSGLATGAMNAVKGMGDAAKVLFTDEAPKQSVEQMTHGAYMRDNADNAILQATGDLSYAVGNMLPSIFASAITGGASLASSLTMGVGAGGNATARALQEGYGRQQSMLYGALIGASEAGLQRVLGGISQLGGGGLSKLAGKIKPIQGALSALDDVFARVIQSPALRYGLKSAGGVLARMNDEGFEEYLQDVLEPVIRNIALGEDNGIELFSKDKAYTYLMGALMGGVFEGVNRMGEAAPNAMIDPQTDPQRALIAQDMQSLGMEQGTVDAALSLHDRLVNQRLARAKDMRAFAQIQSAIAKAKETHAEADADLNVYKTKTVTRLETMLKTAEAAAQAGDRAGYSKAIMEYLNAHRIASAETEAEKLKADNRKKAANRGVESAVAEINAAQEAEAIKEAEAIQQAQADVIINQNSGGEQVGGQEAVSRNADLSQELLQWEAEPQPQPGNAVDYRPYREENATEGGIGEDGEGNAGAIREGQRAIETGARRVERGLAPTQEAEQSIARHIETVRQFTGQDANVRIVNEVDENTAGMIDTLERYTGQKAFLYESDDLFGDGWTDENGIFIRTNGASSVAFVYGHETAHTNPEVNAAGMEVVDELADDIIKSYKEYRDANIYTPDNADIKREMVADVYGMLLDEVAAGSRMADTLGLDEGTIQKFYIAFEKALEGSALSEDVENVVRLAQEAKSAAEYSRIQTDGQRETDPKKMSKLAQRARIAAQMFSDGVTLEEYAQSENFDIAVAKQLRGVYLRNGVSQGGALSEQQMADVMRNSDSWKDKSAFMYGRETLTRNLEDIASSPEEARKLVDTYMTPLRRDVANMTNWEKGWAEEIGALNLNPEESAMVQLIGEGRATPDVLEQGLRYENGQPMDAAKIQKAIETLRRFYDEAFFLANQALIRNGYKPIPKRANYFPHISEVGNGFQEFVNNVIRGQEHLLPTEIAGMTDMFVPGKPWFKNFQRRLGDATDYDAVRGFSNYLQGVSRVIFLTDDIQRIRQLEAAVRGKYSTYDPDSPLQGQERAQHMSNFAAQLLEYGNQLAGKKAQIDRAIEGFIGRKWFARLDWLKKRFGANAVGGNLSTALTNFIPLTQGLATLNKADFARGMQSAIRRQMSNDGLWEKSDFLVSRFNSPDPVVTRRLDKIKKNVNHAAGFLFEAVDRFTAETLVFAKYQEGIRNGLSEDAAMRQADEYAEKTMAQRTIGSVPTLFNSRMLGLVTQFQLEVNNQMSNIMKDIPRSYGGDKKKLVSALVQLFIYSWLYNEINERFITGRRPAFDPVNVVVEAVEDYSSGKAGDATINLGTNILDQLPFGQLLTNGGRVPLASALEGASPIEAIRKSLNGEDASDAWKGFGDALLFNFIPPVGGAQARKIYRGIEAYNKGGSYGASGALRYPIEPGPWNATMATLFGPSAVAPYGYDYRTDNLTKAGTEKYTELVNEGLSQQDAYKFMQGVKLSASNAEQLAAIAMYDRDNDGRPDFTDDEMNITAAILGIEIPKGKSVPQQAKKAYDEYKKRKEADGGLTPEQLEQYENFMEVLANFY